MTLTDLKATVLNWFHSTPADGLMAHFTEIENRLQTLEYEVADLKGASSAKVPQVVQASESPASAESPAAGSQS